MNKVCIGCGSKLQTLDKNKEGLVINVHFGIVF